MAVGQFKEQYVAVEAIKQWPLDNLSAKGLHVHMDWRMSTMNEDPRHEIRKRMIHFRFTKPIKMRFLLRARIPWVR